MHLNKEGNMENKEMEQKLVQMKQKLAVMEWDVQHDQINPAKKVKYNKLKEECMKLEEQLQAQ